MDSEITGNVPCSSLAVDSILRFGMAGLIWGIWQGPYEAGKSGVSGSAGALFMVKSMGGFGLQCGFIGGVYSIAHCGLRQYRRKNDWVNAMIAGSIAGAVVAARTRSWKQLVGVAALISAFATAADFYKTI